MGEASTISHTHPRAHTRSKIIIELSPALLGLIYVWRSPTLYILSRDWIDRVEVSNVRIDQRIRERSLVNQTSFAHFSSLRMRGEESASSAHQLKNSRTRGKIRSGSRERKLGGLGGALFTKSWGVDCPPAPPPALLYIVH